MKYLKLDKEEQKILESYEKGEWKSDKDLSKRIKSLKVSAKVKCYTATRLDN